MCHKVVRKWGFRSAVRRLKGVQRLLGDKTLPKVPGPKCAGEKKVRAAGRGVEV